MGIGKTSALPLFFLREPTETSDSPERSDPFKSLVCLKTYLRCVPMGTLALPRYVHSLPESFLSHGSVLRKKRHYAATKSISFPGHDALCANVEIGVPRCATQSRQPYHLSPITYKTPLADPSDPTDPIYPSDSPAPTSFLLSQE
jgi:hypothetical protein